MTRATLYQVIVMLLGLSLAACTSQRDTSETRSLHVLGPGSVGAGERYSVSGTVNNSVALSWVTLQSGLDQITVTGTNSFMFPTTFYSGSSFAVTLAASAAATGCKIDNGIGTVIGPVTNVLVTCAAPTTATALVAAGLTSMPAGQNGNFSVTANAGGVVSYDFTGYVKFTSSDPNALLPPPYKFTANDAGVHTFAVAFGTAGAQSITAVSGALSSTLGGVTVAPVAPAYLTVSAYPASVTAGQQGNVTITARDRFGNATPSYLGTVHVTSSDNLAVVPVNRVFQASDAGVASVAVTLKTAGLQSITAVDIHGLVLAGSQNNILVNPNVVSSVSVTGFPATVTAGQHAPVLVTITDAYGNAAVNTTDTVTFLSSDLNATLPRPYQFTSNDGGMHWFDAALTTAGTRYIRAVDANRSGVSGQESNILVNPNVGVKMAVSGYPTVVNAGQNSNVYVTVYDAYNNIAKSFNGNVQLSASCPNTAISPNFLVFTPAAKGSIATPVTFTYAGTCALTGNSNTPVMSATEGGIVVSPNVATVLQVAQFPSPTIAGVSGNVTVTAYDAYGNIATGYTDHVALTSSDANATLPAPYHFGATDAGVAHIPVTLATAGNQMIDANGVASPNVAGLQNFIRVVPARADHFFVVNFPNPSTAGQPGNVTIAVFDDYNNLATNYTGTVSLTSTDPNAIFPNSVTMSNANNGSVSVQGQLITAGTWNIDANDVSNPKVAGRQSGIVVNANAAAILLLTNFPSPVPAGQSNNITATAYDVYGNVAKSYGGTIQFASNDPNVTLPPNPTFNGTTGVVTAAVTLATVGNWSLNANDIAKPIIGGVQTPVQVLPGAPAIFKITGYPASITAGGQGNITITAYDTYGNLDTTYRGTVAISSTDPRAGLPSNHTFTGNDNGTTVLPVTLITAGARVISANDTTTPTVSGRQTGITVNPNVAAVLQAGNFTSPINAGVQANIIVTAYDAYGNLATGYTGTLRIRSTDPCAAVPADYPFSGGAANANMPVTLKSVGVWSITGNDTVTPLLNSVQRNIVVNANSASKLTLTGFPATSVAGSIGYATVTAYDDFNNVATGYTGTVHITTTDPNGVPPTDYTFGASDAGTTNLPVQLKTTGNWTLQANDTSLAILNAKQTGRVVSPNVASTMTVTGFPTPTTAGAQNTVVVTVYDAYGNLATGCTDSVHITSTDPNALLPYDASFAGTGNLTFPVTLIRSGTRAINANDVTTPSIFGSQTGITVNPNVPNYILANSYPASVTAGQQNYIHLGVYDYYGNLETTYTGTVALSSSDPNAVLQGNYTFVGGDAGNTNMTAILKTVGTQKITATVVGTAAVNGNQSGIVVNANVGVSHLTFIQSPTNANVCSGGMGAIVQLRDMYNNVIANSNAVTLGWSSNPNSAWLQGNITVNAVNGNATFTGLGVNKAGMGLALSANATNMLGAVSGNFNVINVLPSVTSINAPVNSNTVSTIGYYLSDVCADNANVKVEVWTTATAAYTTATSALGAAFGNVDTPSAATGTGKAVSFSWDNSNALRSVLDTNVYVRMTPTTRNATGPSTIYGPFTVDNRVSFAVTLANASGSTYVSGALAKLDHDAYVDVAVVYTSGNTKTGLFNGTSFDPAAATIATGASTRGIAIADLDRNGYNDMVTVSGTNTMRINWLSAGTNSNTTTNATGTTPVSVTTADINLDGYTDIVVANSGDQNLTIYLGASTGFQTGYNKTLPAIPSGISASDMDRDGQLDLIVTSSTSNAVYVLINDGSAFFATHTVNTYVAPAGAHVVDVDRNGTKDLVVLTPGNNSVAIFSNDGNGLFAAPYGFYTIASAVDMKSADFDNDGFRDVAVLASSGTLAVHRGLTGGQFAGPVSIALSGTYSGTTPGTMRQLLVSDINLDGRPDLFVGADQGSLLLLNTTPRRTTVNWGAVPFYFTGGSSASSVAVADVNADGMVDVVTADPVAGKIIMFTNKGNGTLSAPVSNSVAGSPNILIKAAVNHDHIPDFLAANYGSNNVGIWLGTGATGLTAQSTLACGGTPTYVAAGDLNQDGHTDVVVTVSSTNSLLRFLGNGDGTFGTSTSYATGNGPTGVALADLNGDGILDVVVTNGTASTVATMFGTGTGAFQSLATYSSDSKPQSPLMVDINADGRPDVIAGILGAGYDLWLTNADGSLASQGGFIYTGVTRNLVGGDWDKDGYADIAGIYYDTQLEPLNIVYFKGSAVVTGYERRSSNSVLSTYNGEFLTTGDLNGDGYLDIVTADGPVPGLGTTNATISVLLNNASGSQTIQVGSFNPGSPASVSNRYSAAVNAGYLAYWNIATADVTGDGILDIVQAEQHGSSGVNVYAGSGSGGFTGPNQIAKTLHGATFNAAVGTVVTDINRDSWPDIIFMNESSYIDYAKNGKGMAWNSFYPWQAITGVGSLMGGGVPVDFDRNGTNDLLFEDAAAGLYLWTNDGNGTFTASTTAAGCNNVSISLGAICVADVDNNGTADVITDGSSNAICIQLGNGSGGFSSGPTSMSMPRHATTCSIGDLNTDGKPDVVVGSAYGAPLYMAGNGDGTFVAGTSVPADANSLSVLVEDVNGDGNLDVVYEVQQSGGIAVALGAGNGSFKTPTYLLAGAHINVTSSDFAFQSSIIAADFDRDGRKDLAVLGETSYLYILYGR